MLNYKLVLPILSITLSLAGPSAHGGAEGYQDASNFEQGYYTKVFGKKSGVDFKTGEASLIRPGIQSGSTFNFLDASFKALNAYMSEPNTINGTTYTEVYSFGKRIFSQSFYFKPNGTTGFSAGLTPTQVRVPVVTYPVGPATLELDGGARFQADVTGQNMSTIGGNDSSLNSLGIDLQAKVAAAGFVEGYAKLLVVRAGVGGQIDLIDARGMVTARYTFDGNPPLVTAGGIAEFFKGRVYAFLDLFSIGDWGWKRLLDHSIYEWHALCFAAGTYSCPVKQ